jgi:hypothetical protein
MDRRTTDDATATPPGCPALVPDLPTEAQGGQIRDAAAMDPAATDPAAMDPGAMDPAVLEPPALAVAAGPPTVEELRRAYLAGELDLSIDEDGEGMGRLLAEVLPERTPPVALRVRGRR